MTSFPVYIFKYFFFTAFPKQVHLVVVAVLRDRKQLHFTSSSGHFRFGDVLLSADVFVSFQGSFTSCWGHRTSFLGQFHFLLRQFNFLLRHLTFLLRKLALPFFKLILFNLFFSYCVFHVHFRPSHFMDASLPVEEHLLSFVSLFPLFWGLFPPILEKHSTFLEDVSPLLMAHFIKKHMYLYSKIFISNFVSNNNVTST